MEGCVCVCVWGGGGREGLRRAAGRRGKHRRAIEKRNPSRPSHHHSPQSLYLLIITNKGSNILEDLETLRLLAKVRVGGRKKRR